MNDRIKDLNRQWQDNAIAKCMDDPEYAAKVDAGLWCAECDMRRPGCLCDKRALKTAQ